MKDTNNSLGAENPRELTEEAQDDNACDMSPSNFYLPPPSKLEATSLLSHELLKAIALEFVAIVPPAPSEKVTHEKLLERLGQQLEILAQRLDSFFVGLVPAVTGFGTKAIDYDKHFLIVRVDGNIADLLVAENIAAFCSFFKDMRKGGSLVALELYMLFSTVQSFVARFIPEGENS